MLFIKEGSRKERKMDLERTSLIMGIIGKGIMLMGKKKELGYLWMLRIIMGLEVSFIMDKS